MEQDKKRLSYIRTLTDVYLNYQDSIVGMIYARFKGHLDRMKVEDIYSYAFEDTYMKINKGKFAADIPEKKLKQYLYSVCYRQACKKTERNREIRMPEINTGDDAGTVDEGQLLKLMGIVNAHEGGNEVVNACDEAECQHAMGEAMRRMKDNCRQVLIDHYWEGFSYDIIAEGLGKNADAIKMQAKRCKDTFSKKNQHLLELCRK